MKSILNKNGIFTGPIDSFCLICATYFKDANEIKAHIKSLVHLKNLEATPYADKYKDDRIRKVKWGYYCEFCNLLLATLSEVDLHVSNSHHRNSKVMQLLNRTSSGVLAFGNILINEGAWHGIIDKTCYLCNIEFEDKDYHITTESHVLNLIETNVELEKTSLYRKIDEGSFQCLTCNEVVAINSFTDHFQSLNHNKKHQECYDSGIELASKIELVHDREEDEQSNSTEVKSNGLKAAQKENKRDTSVVQIPKNLKELDTLILECLGIKDYIKEINDDLFYCLVCNGLNHGEIKAHCISDHHMKIFKLHKDKLKTRNADPEQIKGMLSESLKFSEIENRPKILNALPELQKNNVNIDNVNQKIVCKKCSKVINFKYDYIKSHIEGHKQEMKQNKSVAAQSVRENLKDVSETVRHSLSSKDKEEIEVIAKKNNMEYKNHKVYCKCCETYLPVALKNVKQHVEGANHKFKQTNNVDTTKMETRVLKKLPLFTYSTSIVDLVSQFFEDVVVNKQICVNKLSYFLLMPISDTHVKCACCSCVIMTIADIASNHLNTASHAKAFSESLVIVIDSEFIREVPTGKYHCGYCNIVESSWEDMEKHLETSQHKEHKGVAEHRLQTNIAVIKTLEKQQKMELHDFANNVHVNTTMN